MPQLYATIHTDIPEVKEFWEWVQTLPPHEALEIQAELLFYIAKLDLRRAERMKMYKDGYIRRKRASQRAHDDSG